MSALPKKEMDAISQASIPKPVGQYSPCAHTVTRVERMDAGHIHHAREVCAVCGRFIRWLPKPETVERRRSNAIKLGKLTSCAGLDAWQRNFVRDIWQQQCLSPRQQCKLDEIAATHLKEDVAS